MRGAVSALTALLLLGCTGEDRSADARALVGHYAEAVSGGSADRGWGLLHPEMRRLIFEDNEAEYLALAEAADWSTFQVVVADAAADDVGGSLYFVSIRAPAGPDSVPTFLLAHREWSLLPLVQLAGRDPTTARVGVRFEPQGGGGMWAAHVAGPVEVHQRATPLP
jgi:hypothetical protein